MRLNLLLVVLCASAPLLPGSESHKILVYNTIMGHSHVKFLSTLADLLTGAGHDVTVLLPVIDILQRNTTALKKTKKIIYVERAEKIAPLYDKRQEKMKDIWVTKFSPTMILSMIEEMKFGFTSQCEEVLNDKALIERLRAEKFDLALGEPFCQCPFLLFDILDIPAYVSALSSVNLDHVSSAIGQPIATSWVPGTTSTHGEKMNMGGRISNTIHFLMGRYMFSSVGDSQQKMAEIIHPSVKKWREIVAQSSFVFTNSHPLLDFPAPTLEKIIPIGGINVQMQKKNLQLSEEWSKILSERETTVLVSFGSNILSKDMPKEYKDTLLTVFKNMPGTTFIWKYEEADSTLADHLPNVHLSTWMPQNELLADNRLTAFLTHGGLGSTTEIAFLGKPSIMLPCFADQARNAEMLSRHGGALVLSKDDLEVPQNIESAIRKIIEDKSYSENARKLAEKLRAYPVDPVQKFLDYVDFAAKFGRLPSLDPYGRHLTLAQYYLLDIVGVIVGVLLTLLVVSILAVRFAYRKICGSGKTKKE